MTEKYLTVDHFSLKRLTRIFGNIHIDPEVQYKGTPCWVWTACIRRSDGYGHTAWGHKNIVLTHRLMYAWLVEPLPLGASKTTPNIDHLCKRRECCNPIHLELVSPRVNTLRGTSPCAKNALKTHCMYGHPFTPENTYIRLKRPLKRECKTCRRAPGYSGHKP